MKNLRWLAAPFAAAALMIVMACSGDSNDDSPAATPAGSTGVPAASTGSQTGATAPAASTTVSASPPPSSGSSTGAASPPGNALDVSAVAANLENVRSFRYDFSLSMDFDLGEAGSNEEQAMAAMFLALLGNLEAEGAYVAPDRMSMSMNLFGTEIQTIAIGDESWTNDGAGWAADTGEDGGLSMPFEFDPSEGLPFDFLPQEVLEGGTVTEETINGIDATRYSFDKESLESLAATLGDEAGLGDLGEVDSMTLDLWVSEDGVPVKMAVSVAGESEGSQIAIDLEFNIKDLNDDSITIERPI